jgi:amino acid adenylation domain-containing protein
MDSSVEGFRLSPQQRNLWSLQQTVQGRAFRAFSAIRIDGDLSAPRLQQAVEELVSRHEILRTTFVRPPGIKNPFQVIGEAPQFSWSFVDLSGLDAGQQEISIAERIAEIRGKDFDLAHGPLLDLTLIKRDKDAHVLLVSLPALCGDSMTLTSFTGELCAAYARQEGSTEPMQYADFAEWQHELLEADNKDAQAGKNHWRSLQNVNAVLTLPHEVRLPHPDRFEPASLSVDLNAIGVEAFAREQGASVSEVLFACWQALMWRLSGETESKFVLYHLFAGRNSDELEDGFGLYAKYLPVQCDCEDASFSAHLRRVSNAVKDADKWQDYFDPATSTRTGSLVAYEFEDRANRYDGGGLTFTIVDQYACVNPFKLKLSCVHDGAALAASLQYDTHIFDEATVRRFKGYFELLLAGVLNNPQNRLSDTEIVDTAERQLLLDLNQTTTDLPVTGSIHALFEAQVRRTPTALAVVCGDQELTYDELNSRANQLAHLLRRRGVGPEVCVGLCVKRSAEMIAGILGILKAGGAYVPLNPDHPQERLAAQFADCHSNLLITSGAAIGEFAFAGDSIDLQRDRVWLESEPTHNPTPVAIAENLVYVIYTSGSTGVPKGVAVRHLNLINYSQFILEHLEVDAPLTFATVSTITADLGNTVIFPSLLSGGCLHVIDYDTSMEGDLLKNYFLKYRIDVLKIVPSHLGALLATQSDGGILPAKYLILGGEALTWDLLDNISRLDHTCRIINHYGPTETTVGSLTFRVDERDASRYSATVPIGRPIANTRCYILDRRQRPVPLGASGELYIGGSGVAAGYLNRPAETAERFIPDPFARDPDCRLYRTGDLARYLPDFNIEFLGRADRQVKVRGYRVELSEIEAVLSRHAGVRQAVVTMNRDQAGQERIVAYLVSAPASQDQLRAALRLKLPDYMIPSAFVFLKSLPLTANGKIDHAALPAPEDSREGLQSELVAPRSAVERELAGIWSNLLKLDAVGVHDNFFDLGGHSLLATQLVSRMRREFRMEISLRSLFETPTIAALAEKIEKSTDDNIETIKPRRNRETAEVSFAQQRLWFLDQLEDNRALYNVPRALHLTGVLDIEALQRTLSELVSRHEPFRTHFQTTDGTLRQIISDHAEIVLTCDDLSNLPNEEREQYAARVTREEATRPFDLAEGPVIRARLLRLDEHEHILLLTTHHIVSDAWSAGILFKELGELYNAFSRAQPSPLAPLPIQYADFAEWQRTWLQNDVLEQQISYWRNKLDGMTGILELPTDRARASARGSHGALRSLTLSQALFERLDQLSKREGATPFMTLLAAFQILLWRYSDQEDIAVGSPIAGRNREEIENLIGFFVNTLVLRTDLSGNPTFLKLLEQVKDTALAAYAHQDLPFEKLVEELQPERDLARNPLFQVMFQFHNALPAPLELNGLKVRKLETFTQTAKFELMLVAYEHDGALKCLIEYDTGLFASETIERMLQQYATLLESIVANPEGPIASLALMTGAEQRQLLVEWNDTQTDFPREQTIHQLFQEQAARTPDQLALIDGNERVTYGELNARANQLAHYLRRRGVGPEVRVAICLERSAEMIVALLAVLKAGAAYVPLEPKYPAERTAFILQDSQARLLLTQDQFRDSLPATAVETIYLDAETSRITEESAADSLLLTSAESAAHVIYTSGSTGQPKGVISAHRASINRFAWMWQTYPFAAGEVCCQKTSLSFVDSIWEIFGPLLQGVPLVIIPDEVVKDPDQFFDALSINKITRLVLVPSLLRVMLETGQDLSRKLGLLRYCVCSGETLTVDLAAAFREQLPHTKLINLFGSSEVAADVTCFEVDNTHELDSIPIGRPIANTELYILDSNFEPAPVGATGEICIGGEGLARGYLDRPELTAERFVPHPFSKQPGARLFRMGDTGRYRPDGNVEYRGRRDHQVKVRGFRVELGEIEATLTNHPKVEQAIVVAIDDARGEKQLVAYVSANGETPTNSELRAHLRRTLADYMIPAGFVFLSSFPLTASGKINRLALPRPEPGEFATRADFIAPRSPTEEVLASIWSNILDVADVGALDDFFALGGHSLLLVQVASQIRESFQVQLPLRVLFEAPVLAALAERVDEARRTAEGLDAAPLVVVPRDGEAALSFAQERLWVFEQLEPNTGAYNISRMLRLNGLLDTDALDKSVNAIIARHEVLRSRFSSVYGKPQLMIDEWLTMSLPVTDLSTLPADDQEVRVKELAARETQRPFYLAIDPLIRLELLRLSDREHILLLTMHHLISDAWSIGVFMRELVAHYNAFITESSPSLPALPVQYVDFAVWQRKILSGETLQKQLEYWRDKLAGAPAVIKLPADRPRPPVRSFQGARQSFIITNEIREELKTLARGESATLFMTLLTAFQSLLSCLANETDISVGSPVAGRNQPETEPLIGYFVNTLVLRADLSGDPTFRESLRRTRETALGAFANQDLPFEKLVEDLNPARTVAYNPLFQVWFVMQQPFVSRQEFEGLTVQYLDSGTGLTRHDLQLSLWESANGLEGAFTYSTALFDAETIDCMVDQFKGLLAIVVEHPETRLSVLRDSVNESGRAYRSRAIAGLEETARLKLKSVKRKVVVDVAPTAVEESWTNPNR